MKLGQYNGMFIFRYLVSAAGLICIFFVCAPVFAGGWEKNVRTGGFDDVHIYTPDALSPVGNGRALLVVLHGCIQPIDNFLTANLEEAAEQWGMVIAIPDAVDKAGFACWSYWDGKVDRNSGDYARLISLVKTFTLKSPKQVDPNQIYIAGFSSGATFAAQAACAAPDVFAGVAPSAGPSIGTSATGAIRTCESVQPDTFKQRCETYAGSSVKSLATQMAVVSHGTADTTVNLCYNENNANGYAKLYGVQKVTGTNAVADGSARKASETLWQDNRVAMLWLDKIDHSWSGGNNASGAYVSDKSINIAAYLGEFFSKNNLRIK